MSVRCVVRDRAGRVVWVVIKADLVPPPAC